MTLVHVDIADRVATLTLDDPDRRNALTLPMVDEIIAAMDQIESDENVGAIVVTGAPPAFCAGPTSATSAALVMGRASARSTKASSESPGHRCRPSRPSTGPRSALA